MFDNYTDRVRDLALLSDELRVVLAIERSLQVWNLESSQSARWSVEHGSAVTAVVITPDGRRAWILKGPQNRQAQGRRSVGSREYPKILRGGDDATDDLTYGLASLRFMWCKTI